MDKLIRITVLVEEKKTKDGRAFKVYKAVTKNGALVDLKFRKEVTKLPTKKSVILVHPDNINEEKNTAYPRWWVKEVEAIEDYEVNVEHNRKRVFEVFGESEETED